MAPRAPFNVLQFLRSYSPPVNITSVTLRILTPLSPFCPIASVKLLVNNTNFTFNFPNHTFILTE